MSDLHPSWTAIARPVIGMLHLMPLAGSPRYGGSIAAIRELLLRDADALVSGGVDGLMLENFGDVPFYPDRVPAYVVAQITALAGEVKRRFAEVPLGINVLRNDGRGALAVAHAVGGDFIRVNVLCSARVTDQGIIQGIAHDLLRERAILGATGIRILADVDVKHSAPLALRPIEDEVDDTIERGLADALIVSGAGTGKPTDPQHVERVKRVAKQTPILIGSGASVDSIAQLALHCDGFVVGTAFKRDGKPSNPVEADRVRSFVSAVR